MHVLLRAFEPWRLFFPSALLLAPLNVLLWLATRAGLIAPPGIDSAAWHAREMLFGYGFAVIAGYLLKAMPLALVLLLWLAWLAGRILWLVTPGLFAGWLELLVGGAFPLLLAVLGVQRFAVIKRARNLAFPLVMVALGIAGIAAYSLRAGMPLPPHRSPTVLAVYVIALLIMIMGGRLVPTATIGLLRAAGREFRIPPRPLLELATVVGMLALLALDGFGPPAAAGLVALAVAGILVSQIRRWSTRLAVRDMEVWPLHLGFLWLTAGCGLIGLERLGLIAPSGTGTLHALAAGGIGTVTLVMIIRVTRYRAGMSGRSVTWFHAAQATLALAILLRVAGGWLWPSQAELMLWLSASAWTLAYAGTATLLIPMAVRPARSHGA